MLTYSPFDTQAMDTVKARVSGVRGNLLEGIVGPVNVGELERYGSIAGGVALVATGLSRRSIPGLLLAGLGGMFIMRGIGGHCKLYDSIGVSTADASSSGQPAAPHRTGTKVEKTIFIARPPEDLFRFWRNLENLPEFMDNLESVRVLDDRRSHWTVKAPAGQSVEWDAEIVNEHPGEMISWQTLPGSDVQSAGTVRFSPAPGGTDLRVILEFNPPAGQLGATVARLFGKDPAAQLDQDLGKLKQIIEATTAAGNTVSGDARRP